MDKNGKQKLLSFLSLSTSLPAVSPSSPSHCVCTCVCVWVKLLPSSTITKRCCVRNCVCANLRVSVSVCVRVPVGVCVCGSSLSDSYPGTHKIIKCDNKIFVNVLPARKLRHKPNTAAHRLFHTNTQSTHE